MARSHFLGRLAGNGDHFAILSEYDGKVVGLR
jgi:hypothetical protein